VIRRVLLALALVGAPACKRTVPPGGTTNATAMGSWQEWRDLTPLVEIAEHHAPPVAAKAMAQAQQLLREGKAKEADAVLSSAADGSGQAWIAVARADLAALHFQLCIRGIAWRLLDGKDPSPTDRAVDFSEATRIEPGDVSVEATLTNLDIPLASQVPASHALVSPHSPRSARRTRTSRAWPSAPSRPTSRRWRPKAISRPIWRTCGRACR
jgi:hypothetical protein